MRADFMTHCDPTLPDGIPFTPVEVSQSHSPVHPMQSGGRKRKHNPNRLRHSQVNGTSSGRSMGATSALVTPVSDPQTLQEKRELLEYFQKLRVLVPSLPKTGKVPKLDVIEHVIHYIRQLENQLIDHPMIQVLENNAYISGLLQSMAPDFDISHLFPVRNNSQQSDQSEDFSPDTEQHQYSSNPRNQSTLYPESDRSHNLVTKHKSRSVRKPLRLLASSNCSN